MGDYPSLWKTWNKGGTFNIPSKVGAKKRKHKKSKKSKKSRK